MVYFLCYLATDFNYLANDLNYVDNFLYYFAIFKADGQIFIAVSHQNEQPSFFKNGPIPASFSVIFRIFKQTLHFIEQINVKNVMSIKYTVTGF